MRALPICACALAAAAGGCGADGSAPTAAPMPSSGMAYRSLVSPTARRSPRAVAIAQRRPHGALPARQLRAVDPGALRDQLDDAYGVIADQRRSVAEVCTEVLPFLTPGLRLSFDGAKDNHDGTFTVETTSSKRLSIRGRVSPPPALGRVVARREVGPHVRRTAAVGPDGRFALPGVKLRKLADNTFSLTIEAPPNATPKVLFSAICLDCGATPPSPPQE